MKLDQFLDKSVETTEEFESQEFAIDSESLGVLFKGFSDSLYSDKIGSIVREITSNCFDSHIEAGVTRDVEIEITNDTLDGKQGSIIFRDFGVGLSPERISNVYRKYFASTKRGDNNAIGGFGIGAKTPLSYTDIFTVVTRYNGIEYTYMVHRGLTVPELKLIEKTTTDKHNGTEVIIVIKNYVDRRKFIDALKSQLMYFEGITFINCEISNDYKIYRGKTFLYRPGQTTYKDQMHAVIGKVAYPINFSQLGLYYMENKTPVAVRFEIGEIAVTMTRESIEYTESTIEVMKKRIQETYAELQAIYDKRIRNTDDLMEAIKHRTAEPKVYLDDNVYVVVLNKLVTRSVMYNPFKDILHKYAQLFSGDFLGMFLEIRCWVDKYGNKDDSKAVLKRNITDLFLAKANIYRTKDKVTKRKSLYLAEQVGSYYVVSLRWDWREAYSQVFKYFSVEEADMIRKHALKLVIDNSKSYDQVEITKEWLDNYLGDIRGMQAVYRDQTTISVKTLMFDQIPRGDAEMGEVFSMDVYKISELANFTHRGGLIVYSSYDESEVRNLVCAGAVISCIPYLIDTDRYYRLYFRSERVKLLKVSKESIKKLEKLPNTVSASDFLTKRRSLVMRTLVGAYFYENRIQISVLHSLNVLTLIPEAEKHYSLISTFRETYFREPFNDSIRTYLQSLLKTFEQDLYYRYFNHKKGSGRGIDMYYTINRTLKVLKPLRFLTNMSPSLVEITPEYMQDLREYLIFKKVLIKTA